jgi:hypothetical protein
MAPALLLDGNFRVLPVVGATFSGLIEHCKRLRAFVAGVSDLLRDARSTEGTIFVGPPAPVKHPVSRALVLEMPLC